MFLCEKCNKSYKNKYNLERHYNTEWHKRGSGKIRKKHECKICNFITHTPTNLRQHKSTNKHKFNEIKQMISESLQKKQIQSEPVRA